jgi:YgiT-type zinc finger domain-containing protein
MNCVICKTGELQPGRATVTLQRSGTTVVIKEVPADICDNCGEYYLSDEMSARALAIADDAVRKGTEVEVLRWAA